MGWVVGIASSFLAISNVIIQCHLTLQLAVFILLAGLSWPSVTFFHNFLLFLFNFPLIFISYFLFSVHSYIFLFQAFICCSSHCLNAISIPDSCTLFFLLSSHSKSSCSLKYFLLPNKHGVTHLILITDICRRLQLTRVLCEQFPIISRLTVNQNRQWL